MNMASDHLNDDVKGLLQCSETKEHSPLSNPKGIILKLGIKHT